MAIKELENLDNLVDSHAHFPVEPDFSKGWARSIVKRSETVKAKPPLVIRRFMDRLTGSDSQNGHQDKLARDFYQKDFQELPQHQQDNVRDLLGKLWNPAGTSDYLKQGLSFGEAHDLLLAAYRAENDRQYPQEIRSALSDFARGLERDLEEAAKAGGFYPEYSRAEKSLRAAVKEIRANGNN